MSDKITFVSNIRCVDVAIFQRIDESLRRAGARGEGRGAPHPTTQSRSADKAVRETRGTDCCVRFKQSAHEWKAAEKKKLRRQREQLQPNFRQNRTSQKYTELEAARMQIAPRSHHSFNVVSFSFSSAHSLRIKYARATGAPFSRAEHMQENLQYSSERWKLEQR